MTLNYAQLIDGISLSVDPSAPADSVTLDSSGNFAIGTGTSPGGTRLHVRKDSNQTVDQIYVQNRFAGGGSTARIAMGNGSTDYGNGYFAYVGAQISGTNQTGNHLIFGTNADAAAPTEKMRLTTNGYLSMAFGTGGIQFNGDTAAANALDDYEEGTFDPSWANITGGSLLNAAGRYIKVGTLVWCVAAIKNNSTTAGADASTASFTLPFAPLTAGSFADYVQNIGTVYVGTAGGAGGGSTTNQSTYLAYNRNNASGMNLRSGTVTIPIKGFLIIVTCYNAAA